MNTIISRTNAICNFNSFFAFFLTHLFISMCCYLLFINFFTSKNINPIELAAVIIIQSFMFNGVNSKTSLIGVYMIKTWRTTVNKTAPIKYLFENKFTFFNDNSDLHEKTKNIWNITEVVTAIVLAFSMLYVVRYSNRNKLNIAMNASSPPTMIYNCIPLSICSFGFLGERCIIV